MHDEHHDHDHEHGGDWHDRVNDAYYDRLGEGMGRATRERIHWMCAQCTGRTALDVGCSQGITSILLAREGLEVVGIDIDDSAVAFAERERDAEPDPTRARLAFRRMDLAALDPSERYDNVLLGEVVEHQTSAARFLQAAARHVAPGGRLVVTVPFGLHPFPDHKCTVFPRDLVDALPGFGFDTLEVVDGYVRAVARRESPRARPDTDELLAITQAGTCAAQARYFELLGKSRELQAAKKAQVERAADLRARLDRRDADAKRLQAERDSLAEKLDKMRNEAVRTGRKIEQMADYRQRLEHQHDTVKGWLRSSQEELAFIRGSVSFQLGVAIVSAFRSPRALLALPVRIVRIFGARARRGPAPRPIVAPPTSGDDDPAGERWQPSLPTSAASSAEQGSGPQPALRVLDVAAEDLDPVEARIGTFDDVADAPARPGPLPGDLRALRVATVMDEFSFAAFSGCCDARQLTPGTWREDLDAFQPHLLLVESAWRGAQGAWAQKVYPLSDELRELVAAARERGIPSAFWNKEDPVHFSIFVATARIFDHVFTTDVDCVQGYRKELGHDRVHFLPFACDPAAHNPLETYEREPGCCFAGSYYAKYPERQRDFAALIDALRQVGPVCIFDRNHGKDDPALAFPEPYRPLIRGNLAYGDIARAYKGFRFGLNINTVKQSQTMFARRVFDLLASNTVTVSNFSRGVRLLFGDLVISTDDAGEAVRRLRSLDDEASYRKLRLLGLRKVMAEHTYADRMALVVERVAGIALPRGIRGITVLAAAANAGEAARVVEAFGRQCFADRRLVLVCAAADAPVPGDERIVVLSPDAAATTVAASIAGGRDVAFFHPHDYYGPAYLQDLALARRYSDAPVIAKIAHRVAAGDSTRLSGDGAQYREHASAPLRAALVAPGELGERPVAALLAMLDDAAVEARTLAIDEFNYCRDWPQDTCPDADDAALDTGATLGELAGLAEGDIDAPARSGARVRGYGPGELAALFAPGAYASGRVDVAVDATGLQIVSRLSERDHAYVYAQGVVPLEAMFPDAMGRFHVRATADNLLSTVLLFLDERQQRIGYVIRATNSNQSVSPIEGTRFVSIGFRVQGPGLATVRQLLLDHMPSPVAAIAAQGDVLVVARSYPRYDALYSYTFVHRRVRAYRDAGMRADVFQLDDRPLAFREFEDVDVVSGGAAELALMLRGRRYRSILVHSPDEQAWAAIEPALDRVERVLVWLHGAEVQPWYRRDFNFVDEDDRRRGIQRSDVRMAFWRQMLERAPANVHFVFVSHQLARQAQRDLGVTLAPGQWSVVHNFVDGDFFTYRPKPVEQRLRVLSVRPYTKATYANDLAVKAVLELSREPWFPELDVTLVGDGPLFDETTAPLRGRFANVCLEKRFLDANGLREHHRSHGVFLVPSRADAQGLSRDEAMASGLVPVTSRVGAIPEFVDADVAFLAPPEDAGALADAIRTLRGDPARFERMSEAAAARVRRTCGREATIARELALVSGRETALAPAPCTARVRVAVCADIDLNRLDGSSVWVASLAEVLAGLPDVDVDLVLKTRLARTQVIDRLLRVDGVRFVEPGAGENARPSTPDEAVERLLREDAAAGYRAVCLRGFRLALAASAKPALHGRLWTYLTDIPQTADALDATWIADLGRIAAASRYLLCQTPQLERLLAEHVPGAAGRTRLLPPMVPPAIGRASAHGDGALRVVYAGKFAPAWGVDTLIDAVVEARAAGKDVEAHIFGDKFHRDPSDPEFATRLRARMEQTEGVHWHGATGRDAMLAQLPGMHLAWAWRDPAMEAATLELSTKLLEYGAAGLPVIATPGPANLEALGTDYPLFAPDAVSAAALLRAADLAGRMRQASSRALEAAAGFGFDAARHRLEPLLAAEPGA